MYLVGAAHPHKDDARRLLERAIAAGERLVTDALHVAVMRRHELSRILTNDGGYDRESGIERVV